VYTIVTVKGNKAQSESGRSTEREPRTPHKSGNG
jgi:hypothetical protein